MSQSPAGTTKPRKRAKNRIARRLYAAGWGLFFIWLGMSLLMDLSWGVGLIGVSAIVLLGQAARWSFGLRLVSFWVVVGVLFLLGGIWELYNIDVDLLPILLMLAGGALMLSLFRRGSRTDWRDSRSDWRDWCRGASYHGAEGWRCCSWSTEDR